MFCDWSNSAGVKSVFKYQLDPNEIISQMMLDPRLSYTESEALKTEIRRGTGYKGDIKRSLLYRLPANLTLDVTRKI